MGIQWFIGRLGIDITLVRGRTVRFGTLLGLLSLGYSSTTMAQIAAQYPNDVGIRNHPSVIYATGFDSSNWLTTDFPSGIRVVYLGGSDQTARPVWTGAEAFTGTGALLHRQLAGTNLPHGMTIMGFQSVNEIYMRWYRKYQAGYKWGCQSAKNNGVYAVANDDTPEACVQPTGYDKFSFRVQDERRSSSTTGEFYGALYSYHPHADNGGCGEWYSQNVNGIKYQQSGVWTAYEIYIKANTVGQRNGVIRMWINGELRGQQEGLEFRYTDALKINQVYLYGSTGGCDTPYTQNVWDDNLVVAKEYIGPMVTTTSPVPRAPTNVRIIR
jgi:Polysaccharide lyase 14